MYDMYPEWGPARHEDDHHPYRQPLQEAMERREDPAQRPDDN
jgi:hypothetical protein